MEVSEELWGGIIDDLKVSIKFKTKHSSTKMSVYFQKIEEDKTGKV